MQADQKNYHDRHSRVRQFAVGQTVMALNMREGPKWRPGVVVEQLGPLTYLVEVQGGLKWKRHSDHLRDGSGVPPELLTTDLNEENLDDTYYPPQSNSVPTSNDSSMDHSPDISLQQSSTVSSQNKVRETQSGTESTSLHPTRIRKPPNRYS